MSVFLAGLAGLADLAGVALETYSDVVIRAGTTRSGGLALGAWFLERRLEVFAWLWLRLLLDGVKVGS